MVKKLYYGQFGGVVWSFGEADVQRYDVFAGERGIGMYIW